MHVGDGVRSKVGIDVVTLNYFPCLTLLYVKRAIKVTQSPSFLTSAHFVCSWLSSKSFVFIHTNFNIIINIAQYGLQVPTLVFFLTMHPVYSFIPCLFASLTSILNNNNHEKKIAFTLVTCVDTFPSHRPTQYFFFRLKHDQFDIPSHTKVMNIGKYKIGIH